MQPRITRQIINLSDLAIKPPELSWHEYIIFLLQLGASVEHALMVQYLYAAYSLRADRPPADQWRESLLLIAREEMAHLLTVQNILALLGGPHNIDREDYPYDVPFDAFPFQLERLTKGSLACYVYAEMPPDLEKKEEEKVKAIRTAAEKHVGEGARVNHVGTLYSFIVQILADPNKIPDHCFRGTDFGQMSWDEWGRSYQGEKRDDKNEKKHGGRGKQAKAAANRSQAPDPEPSTRADLFIRKVITREEAIIALAELSAQGEGLVPVDEQLDKGPLRTLKPYIPDIPEPDTHYKRFLKIYDALHESDHPLRFSWEVATNPVCDFSDVATGKKKKQRQFVLMQVDEKKKKKKEKKIFEMTQIENKCSRRWAALFNVRYRMLLNWLAHALTLVRRDPPPPTSHLRGQIMHRVFGEMYNLKALAELLVQMPLKEGSGKAKAGPPFQMPYRAALPPNERDIWVLHKEVLVASGDLCNELLGDKITLGFVKDDAQRKFLLAMQNADRDAFSWVNGVVAGLDK